MYRVNSNAPCTVFALVDVRAPAWEAADGWQSSGLSGAGVVYSIYKKYFPAGEIDLKRLRDGGSQGTSYVFKAAGGSSVWAQAGFGGTDNILLSVAPNPFQARVVISVAGLREGSQAGRGRGEIIGIDGKVIKDLNLGARSEYAWSLAPCPREFTW